MPLYEYQCDRCNEVFEVMQKFSDQPLTTHEKCGGTVHRLVSASTFKLKGSGWYATDYAKHAKSPDNGGSKKADAASGETKASESGGETQSKSSSAEKTSSSETKAESSPEKK